MRPASMGTDGTVTAVESLNFLTLCDYRSCSVSNTRLAL